MKDAICCAVPYTPPRCFAGALTITVRVLALLALGLPGAGVVAYLRFDPICLG